ncbi:hypothetical protein D9M68_558400 [compost metagenome]
MVMEAAAGMVEAAAAGMVEEAAAGAEVGVQMAVTAPTPTASVPRTPIVGTQRPMGRMSAFATKAALPKRSRMAATS